MSDPSAPVALPPADVSGVREGPGSDHVTGPRNGHSNGHRNGHAPDDALGRAILLALREGGPSGPDALATRLQMSRTSTLQRLRELETAGFVARQAVRHGVGRPRHLYDITSAAQRSLPANYDGLATTLLESIAEVGGDALVEEVFQARRRLLGDRIRARFAERLGPDASLADKVRELAVVQDESGYVCRAEVTPVNGGPLELREHNCAILGAAAGHPAACRAELQLFEEVLGARVVRTSHIATGDRCCSYAIEPREA
ncbi:MAG: helix-turn-helix transcriptional regulator [Chloroflexi bacterium]|nr:helix-turn-helix transcriptional regulator [Chloroflexota bacterium]